MAMVLPPALPAAARVPQKIHYPDSDGKPMADNTLQWEWIATIKNGLEALFADRPDVFVAGDLLWYPVEGDNKTRVAPDALVAFGRPKGFRGSYRQWEEGGVTPQVVFEVLSPGNRFSEILRKLDFYDRFGVEEYYLYDPGAPRDDLRIRDLNGWLRPAPGQGLVAIENMEGWRSPRLGVTFEFNQIDDLRLIRPDGRPFETYTETSQRADAEQQRADLAQQRADAEQQRADAEQRRADLGQQRTERLRAQLRAAGLEPENGDAA